MLSPNGTARRRYGAVCAAVSVSVSMSCGGSGGDSGSTQPTTTTGATSTTVTTTTDATSTTTPTVATLDVPFDDGLRQRLISVADLPSDWEAYEVNLPALPAELCPSVAGPVDATGMAIAGFSLSTSGDSQASLVELVIGFGRDEDAAAFFDHVTAAAVDCDLPPKHVNFFVPSGRTRVDDALGDEGLRSRLRAGTNEHLEQVFFRSGDVVVMTIMTGPGELSLASMDGLDATIARTAAG